MNNGVFNILRKRYPASEYALMCEVSDAAGHSRSGSLDYLVMNLWPSRGLHLTGIELKSSRSDWLRELKQPDKQERHIKFCDFFYLLTAGDGIANISEIPSTWGWMSIKGSKVHVIKEAPKLTAQPITPNFLAALLKRASEKTNWVHVSDIEERLNEHYKAGEANMQRELHRCQQELERFKKIMNEFERTSGLTLQHSWDLTPAKIGAAVRIIHAGGAEGIAKRMIELKTTAEIILNDLNKGIETLTKTDV